MRSIIYWIVLVVSLVLGGCADAPRAELAQVAEDSMGGSAPMCEIPTSREILPCDWVAIPLDCEPVNISDSCRVGLAVYQKPLSGFCTYWEGECDGYIE